MKTKHLFFTLALSSAFAACTQEELVSNVENNQDALAQRPVAGMVEFSLGDVESRYNHQSAKFNEGESLDLYLMDELNGYYDESDANHMHGYAESVQCWKYFSVWSDMYSFVNYAQTRYPFMYNGTTWSNQATLLEGNYIAMHPGNEKITNRRDVWRYIDPTISLTDENGNFNKFAGLDNQFWLGYTPIYRHEDRTGDMTLPLNMQPIMTVAKLTIKNVGNTDTKIDKIVFKDKDGKALPTIAYVKPATFAQADFIETSEVNAVMRADWRETSEVEAKKTADNCGYLDCQGNGLNSVYDAEKTWPKTSKGRATARGIVVYDNPLDRKPYGLEDTDAAYEYVYQFPEDGYFLEGLVKNGSSVDLYIVLPHSEEFTYEPIIYGRQYVKTVDGVDVYANGILRAKGSDNAIFTLNSIDLDKNTPYVQEVTAQFDQTSFEALTEVKVSTTEDLMTMLKASEPSFTHEKGYYFNVKVYGDDLAITDEVVNYLNEKAEDLESEDKNCRLHLFFEALDRAQTPALVTIDTEKACMDYFFFDNGSVDVAIAKGSHVINYPNYNFEDLTIAKGAELTLKGNLKSRSINNEGTLNVKANVESTIHNENVLTISAGTIDKVINAAEANVDGTATVNTFANDNRCVNCGEGDAVLTVKSGATLTVTTSLVNVDIVNVLGTLEAAKVENDGTINNSGTSKVAALTNDGTINVTAGLFYVLGTSNVNNGTIDIAEGAKFLAEASNMMQNFGIINVEGQLAENIQNSGEIFVKNNGNVVVDGIVTGQAAGIIDVTEGSRTSVAYAAKDKTQNNYFRYTVNNETTAKEIVKSLKDLISENNWTNRTILVWGANSATTISGEGLSTDELNIDRVIIENDLVVVKGKTTNKFLLTTLDSNCAAVDCKNDTYKDKKSLYIKGSLTVDNEAELVLNEGATVFVEGLFKANNSAKVTTPVYVYGTTGVVENYTLDGNFDWQRATDVPAIAISVNNWHSAVGE